MSRYKSVLHCLSSFTSSSSFLTRLYTGQPTGHFFERKHDGPGRQASLSSQGGGGANGSPPPSVLLAALSLLPFLLLLLCICKQKRKKGLHCFLVRGFSSKCSLRLTFTRFIIVSCQVTIGRSITFTRLFTQQQG